MTKSDSNTKSHGSHEAQPREFKEQYLFLLEFYVHHLTGDRLAKLNQMFFVPTSVSLQFLEFKEEDSVEVTPVDPLFHPQAGIADDIEHFYSGRSVMFAMDHNTVTKKDLDLIVKIIVRKKMPDGIKPDVLVGDGELDLSKYFAALRKEMLQCWHRSIPPPKVYEGEVPLNYNDNLIGSLKIHVRMSAFGQTIVTEFNAPSVEKETSSYIFKGDQMDDKALLYKCRVIDSKEGDICKESKDDLSSAACPVCVEEKHVCSPCGQEGATLRPGAVQRDDGMNVEPQSCNLDVVEVTKSKPTTCADGPKNGGLIQTSRGPPQPCGKAVVLKVSGLLDTGDKKKTPTVTVASEAEAIGPDHPPDPEHDVFILRIGKKGLVGIGEKSDIQLEMRTPKGPERRPPIRYETREMQTDAGDKGKKDKKGKKKKK